MTYPGATKAEMGHILEDAAACMAKMYSDAFDREYGELPKIVFGGKEEYMKYAREEALMTEGMSEYTIEEMAKTFMRKEEGEYFGGPHVCIIKRGIEPQQMNDIIETAAHEIAHGFIRNIKKGLAFGKYRRAIPSSPREGWIRSCVNEGFADYIPYVTFQKYPEELSEFGLKSRYGNMAYEYDDFFRKDTKQGSRNLARLYDLVADESRAQPIVPEREISEAYRSMKYPLGFLYVKRQIEGKNSINHIVRNVPRRISLLVKDAGIALD